MVPRGPRGAARPIQQHTDDQPERMLATSLRQATTVITEGKTPDRVDGSPHGPDNPHSDRETGRKAPSLHNMKDRPD